MARRNGEEEDVEIVLEDDEDEELEVSASSKSVKRGNIERYEVSVGPPRISGGRKVKPVRSQEEAPQASRTAGSPQTVMAAPQGVQQAQAAAGISAASTQQLYKIEDDLRRTRDIVEDLKHNVGLMEGEVKDLRAEMERISYLLRSLEGMKNAMKDIESTVSELSGLYDLISANINPFVEIPQLVSRDKVVREEIEEEEEEEAPVRKRAGNGGAFQDLEDIFGDEEEQEEEFEEADSWEGPDLESEEWTLRWTKFLIDKVGKEGLEKTLDYYLDLGWIGEDTIDKVVEIARGTTGPRMRSESGKISWRMDAEDHVKSLEYIKRIRSHGR
ncbi:MAG: FlaD/FlaE family flagellar protein [Thermoplasmatota archaeon]